MASFGPFDTTRQISSTRGADVFAATKKDEGAAAGYVVKVYSPDRLSRDNLQTRSDLDPFLLEVSRSLTSRIRTQKIAGEKSSRIAPILESGRDYRGIWYVTRQFPRTLQKLISGKVALSDQGQLHILRCITEGSLALAANCGRAHGNLNLANVLIGGAARMRDAEVAVTDPAAGEAAEAARFELADLHAIGRILYQLVRRREVTDPEEWIGLSVEASAEWTAIFGRRAGEWVELCNRLLDENLTLESYSLQRLAADLKALQPKRVLSVPAIVGLVLLPMAAVFAWLHWHKPPLSRLEISTDPPGAEIFINGKVAGTAPLTNSFPTNANPYQITAKWWQVTLTNNVRLDRVGSIPVPFKFNYGTIELASDPPGAHVKLNDQDAGVTPLSVLQPAGVEAHYQLDLKDSKYKLISTNLTIAPGSHGAGPIPVLVKIEQKTVGKGTVVFEYNFTKGVSSSVFTISGGTTNVRWPTAAEPMPDRDTETDLDPGHYLIRSVYSNSFSHKIWPAQAKAFDIEEGRTTYVTNNFDYGILEITSAPDTATVFDGAGRLGETPLSRVYWPPGRATFTFKKDGYDPTNLTVAVEGGKTSVLAPQLLTTNGIIDFATDPPGAEIFDANGKSLGRTPLDGSARQLAVPPGVNAFSLRYDGLAEVRTNLPVEKGQTKSCRVKFAYGEIYMDVEPSAASVSWGAKSVAGQVSYQFYQRPGVAVAYRIDGPPEYQSITTNLALASAGQSRTVHIQLPRHGVRVSLTTDPPGGEIFDDRGGPVKIENSMAEFPPGTVTLTATHPNLDPIHQTLTVGGGAGQSFALKFVYGTVNLTSEPAGAVIYSEGRAIGKAPARFYLKPGSYSFAVTLSGRTNEVSVTLAAGETKQAATTFHAAADKSGLTLFGIQLLPLADNYWVGKYDVTQWQYQQTMGKNPSAHLSNSNLPVDSVSRADALEFCRRLTESNTTSKAFRPDLNLQFTLPTKAQWESFAAGELSKPNTNIAIYKRTAPAPVGSLAPNAKGLYDVRGNVWQWLLDLDASGKGVIAGSAFDSRYLSQPPQCYHSAPQEVGDVNQGFRVVLISSAKK